jgi:hypothetical protein
MNKGNGQKFSLKTNMQTDREAAVQKINSGLMKGGARSRYSVLRFLVGGGIRCVRHSLKNCIEILSGRDTCFDEKGLFWRQYFMHVTGLRPIRKVTCTGLTGEGPSSQALMLMNAINFAGSCGLTYVHTPFTVIEHGDRSMEKWVKAWEMLFNLGAGEVVCDVKRHEAVNFSHNFNELDRFGWRCRGDELAERFKASVPEFRRKYYVNTSPQTSDEVTVAVHIRRGDVSAVDPDYFTSNEAILRSITEVKSILNSHRVKYRIRVYSQGKSADFADLALMGAELFLDTDAIWTMQELIEADILIMAKGCFSYYAALISDGIKIFEPRTFSGDDLPSWKWRSDGLTENWIPCLGDGSFDREAFERQLLIVIQAKAMASDKAATGSV